MAILLMDKKELKNGDFLVGCIAIAGNKVKTNIEKFKKEKFEEELRNKWGWVFDNRHTVMWREKTDIYSYEDNIVSGFNLLEKLIMEEIVDMEKKDIPDFVKYTVSDIKKKLFENTKQEPTNFQIQLSTGLVLLNIANFFIDNSDALYDFPLYEAYIKKHNLSKEEYEVFDFIEEISSSASILLEDIK